MTLQSSHTTNRELSYKQSFTVMALILLTGFILQWVSAGINLSSYRFPINILLLIGIISLIFIGYFKFPKARIVIWFSSTKVAIASILGFSAITLLMGLIPQEASNNLIISGFGLNNIAFSWEYSLTLIYLIFALGFATIKRVFPFHFKNSWYILNHLGLWIALSAANFGFVDQQHVRMKINTTEYTRFGVDEKGYFHELPFEIAQTSLVKPSSKGGNIQLHINIKNNSNSIESATISINNPHKTNGWRIYFFDAAFGENNKTKSSVIELIKDPWEPMVSVGLGMMIVGSFFVFWRGKISKA